MAEFGKRTVSLYRKIVLPVFLIIVLMISIFCITSSMIIVRLQNRNTMSLVEQSMEYTYRSISFQLNSMASFVATIAVSNDVDKILSADSFRNEDAIENYYKLYDILQNVSLLSLYPDIGGRDVYRYSYNIAIITDWDNPLDKVAALTYSENSGLYSSSAVKGESWYRKISSNQAHNLWLQEAFGYNKYIYYISRKKSIVNGKDLGVIALGYNVENLKNLLYKDVAAGAGSYIMIDENMDIVYTKSPDFQSVLAQPDILRMMEGERGVFNYRIHGKKSILMYNTLSNGWKLISVVPEYSIKAYQTVIVFMGVLTGIFSVMVMGLVLRRAANAVRMPISDLVARMGRQNVEKEELSWECNTNINEIKIYMRGIIL